MTVEDQAEDTPEALMMLGTHCPHCPYVLASLSDMVKTGALSRLEVINIEARPEIARSLGVQTVPWVRIGDFVITGLQSKSDLQKWANRAMLADQAGAGLEALLEEGRIDEALSLVQADPVLLSNLVEIVADGDAKINARLGVGAIYEEYAATAELKTIIPQLAELLENDDARVRSDACHYLALTGSADVTELIRPLTRDANAEVREVARESLDELDLAED